MRESYCLPLVEYCAKSTHLKSMNDRFSLCCLCYKALTWHDSLMGMSMLYVSPGIIENLLGSE